MMGDGKVFINKDRNFKFNCLEKAFADRSCNRRSHFRIAEWPGHPGQGDLSRTDNRHRLSILTAAWSRQKIRKYYQD